MFTNNQNYLEAIETVLAWDLPDEVFADAINDQFRLMDGLDSESACIKVQDAWDRSQDSFTAFQH